MWIAVSDESGVTGLKLGLGEWKDWKRYARCWVWPLEIVTFGAQLAEAGTAVGSSMLFGVRCSANWFYTLAKQMSPSGCIS